MNFSFNNNSNSANLDYKNKYSTIYANNAEIQKIQNLNLSDDGNIRKSIRKFFGALSTAQKQGKIVPNKELIEVKKLIILLGFTDTEIENRFNINLSTEKETKVNKKK